MTSPVYANVDAIKDAVKAGAKAEFGGKTITALNDTKNNLTGVAEQDGISDTDATVISKIRHMSLHQRNYSRQTRLATQSIKQK